MFLASAVHVGWAAANPECPHIGTGPGHDRFMELLPDHPRSGRCALLLYFTSENAPAILCLVQVCTIAPMVVPVVRLSEVFWQAASSCIVRD
jgi:hypothetical protein